MTESARESAQRLGIPWSEHDQPEKRTRHHVPPHADTGHGYYVPQVCRAAGISYRQLDYWDSTGLVKPSRNPARGSGTQRGYSIEDIVLLRVVRKLLDTGISLQRIRKFIEYLRGLEDMHGSFITNGAKYARFVDMDFNNVIVDMGPTWFAINVAVAYREVEEKLGLMKT